MNYKDLPSLAVMQAYLAVIECGGTVAAEKKGFGDRSNLRRSVAEIEDKLGIPLGPHDGQNHPTRAGRELAEGFSVGLNHIAAVWRKVAQDARPVLDVASSAVVTQVFLPDITGDLERQHPHLCCGTDCGHEAQLRRMLRTGEATIVVAARDAGWRGFNSESLLAVRAQLVVPTGSAIRTTQALFGRASISETLFYSAASDTLLANFDRGMKALGIECRNRRRVASVTAVTRAVSLGHGFGLIVDVPSLVDRPGLRVIDLNFEPFEICAFWQGNATAAIRDAVAALQKLAAEIRAHRPGDRAPRSRRNGGVAR